MNYWSDMMKDQITVERIVSHDAAGNPTYGSPTTYPCRIAGPSTGNRAMFGTIISTRPQIYFDQEIPVGVDDRITVSGFGPTHPPIVGVRQYPDENGTRYTVIDL